MSRILTECAVRRADSGDCRRTGARGGDSRTVHLTRRHRPHSPAPSAALPHPDPPRAPNASPSQAGPPAEGYIGCRDTGPGNKSGAAPFTQHTWDHPALAAENRALSTYLR